MRISGRDRHPTSAEPLRKGRNDKKAMESSQSQATSRAISVQTCYSDCMKILSTSLLTILSFFLATSALARDDRGRTRPYTGMTPYQTSYKVVCPENGSRCYTVMTSSSSSSSSVILERGKVVIKESSTFVPFLKKYVNLPKVWNGTSSDKLATFTRTDSAGALEAQFSVELFDYANCDSESVEERLKKTWSAVGKPVPERFTVGRAYGVQGLAYSWLEPGTGSDTIRNYCIVPLGHVMTARVWTKYHDDVTKTAIERYALPNLYTPRRGR